MGLSSPSQESDQLTSPLYLSFVTEITEVTGGIGGAGTRGGGEGGCPRAATKMQPSATTRTTHPIMGVGCSGWSPPVMGAVLAKFVATAPATARLDRG